MDRCPGGSPKTPGRVASSSFGPITPDKDFVEPRVVSDPLSSSPRFVRRTSSSELAQDIGRLLRRLKRVPRQLFEGHETARIGAHRIGERGDRDDTQKRENVFGTRRDMEDLTEVKSRCGGGKMEASLFDLMPSKGVDDFVEIAKKCADDM